MNRRGLRSFCANRGRRFLHPKLVWPLGLAAACLFVAAVYTAIKPEKAGGIA